MQTQAQYLSQVQEIIHQRIGQTQHQIGGAVRQTRILHKTQ